jgi:hypothetical protein
MQVIYLTIPREVFPDDETYQKALESSKRRAHITSDDEIDITGLDKGDVLWALYMPAGKMGMGFLAPDLTEETVRSMAKDPYLYFDYLGGKPLKVDLTGNSFNGRLYDRDQGVGAARKAVDNLRERHNER